MHLCIVRVLHNVGSFQHTPDKMHLQECQAQQAHNLHAAAINVELTAGITDSADVSDQTCSSDKAVKASPGFAANSRALLQAVPAT